MKRFVFRDSPNPNPFRIYCLDVLRKGVIPSGVSIGSLADGGMMDCSFDTTRGAVVVTAHGKVDEASWEAFDSHLEDGIGRAVEAGSKMLVIDLAQLDYMSSRGLRALTVAKRRADAAGIGITLAAPNDVMREILAISRYDKLFSVKDTIEESL